MSVNGIENKTENKKNKDLNDDPNYKTMKKFLMNKNIDLNNISHLQYLLSLTLKSEQKDFDFQYLLSFLLTRLNEDNKNIFYEYFFQCCELGKLNYIILLLNNQIPINIQNEIGETPMHIAISKKDINLIKLLLEYNVDLLLKTYKDNLTCYNYAEISGNEEIKKLINSKMSSSKEIKSKLKVFINNVETKDTLSSIESQNKNDILNYCGETYKSNTFDKSSLKTSEEEPLKINDIINDKNKDEIILDNQELFENNINKDNNNSLDIKDKNNDKKQLNKTIYQKKKVRLSKSENNQYNHLTEKKPKKNMSIIKDIDIKRNNLSGYSLDTLQPSKNNNINEKENIKEYKNGNENENKNENKKEKIKNYKLEENQNQLEIFFTEIKLPKEYTEKFIDNGFDDLNLLKFQTKSGIALSNQNLKDIGIISCGERAKILIHLEEKSGIIPYFLERDKIYIDEEDYKNNNYKSLYNFLASINLEQYKQNFINNGYYTSELLFTQMMTREPINEEILKEEFNIEKTGHRLIIYNNLITGCKNYVKTLRKRGNPKTIYDGPFLKACDCCIY